MEKRRTYTLHTLLRINLQPCDLLVSVSLSALCTVQEPQQQEVSTSGNRDSLHRANEGTELLVASGNDSEQAQSIHSMTTQAWRDKYEHDGCVDLWMEDEYNAGSRLKVRPLVHCLACCPFPTNMQIGYDHRMFLCVPHTTGMTLSPRKHVVASPSPASAGA